MSTPKQEKEKPKEIVRTFQSAKGMHDVLPSDAPYWERIEDVAGNVADQDPVGLIFRGDLVAAIAVKFRLNGESQFVFQAVLLRVVGEGTDGDFPDVRRQDRGFPMEKRGDAPVEQKRGGQKKQPERSTSNAHKPPLLSGSCGGSF